MHNLHVSKSCFGWNKCNIFRSVRYSNNFGFHCAINSHILSEKKKKNQWMDYMLFFQHPMFFPIKWKAAAKQTQSYSDVVWLIGNITVGWFKKETNSKITSVDTVAGGGGRSFLLHLLFLQTHALIWWELPDTLSLRSMLFFFSKPLHNHSHYARHISHSLVSFFCCYKDTAYNTATALLHPHTQLQPLLLLLSSPVCKLYLASSAALVCRQRW